MKSFINLIFMLFLMLAFSCGGCNDDIDTAMNSGVDGGMRDVDSLSPEACMETCESRENAFIGTKCKENCADKHSDEPKLLKGCQDACTKLVERQKTFSKLTCRTQCYDNEDGDVVPNSMDKCPNTPKGYPVNWQGCRDSDNDGIIDIHDKCKQTPEKTLVNVLGCPLEMAELEKNAVQETPQCENRRDCWKEKEIPLVMQIPKSERENWTRLLFSQKPHPQHCPGVTELPGQPNLSSPGSAIEPVELKKKHKIRFENGKVVDSDRYKMEFKWDKSHSKCDPTTYAILIESYHCHHVWGITEPEDYMSRGWCKWQPLEYLSDIQKTEFNYDLELGKVLFELHQPFEKEQNWKPPQTGIFEASYAPFWVRTRVLAIDGNGNVSPSGMHNQHHYFVFYNPNWTRSEDLVNIPIAP